MCGNADFLSRFSLNTTDHSTSPFRPFHLIKVHSRNMVSWIKNKLSNNMNHSTATACLKILFFNQVSSCWQDLQRNLVQFPPFLKFLMKTGFENSTVKAPSTRFAVWRVATSNMGSRGEGGGRWTRSTINHRTPRSEKNPRAAGGFLRKCKQV